MINWDRRGDGVICLFTGRQIRWIREAVAGYRDHIDSVLDICDVGADVPELVQIRAVVMVLLEDLPERDNVVVFRNEGHRIAWAWLLDALRTMRELPERQADPVAAEWHGSAPGEVSRWLVELIDFLLTASGRSVV